MPSSAKPPLDPASDALFREMRDRVRQMFELALTECSIPVAFRKKLSCEHGYLRAGSRPMTSEASPAPSSSRWAKPATAWPRLSPAIVGTGLGGIVACPDLPPAQLFGFRYFAGGHPLPNRDSLLAGDAMLRAVQTASPETLIIYLISGGASAIAEKPISPNISLPDIVTLYQALVHCGAPIAEINAIRKHLSAIKGGRLAASRRSLTPTLGARLRCTRRLARRACLRADHARQHHRRRLLRIAKRYGLLPHLPLSVHALFQKHLLPETPKAKDTAFARSAYSHCTFELHCRALP